VPAGASQSAVANGFQGPGGEPIARMAAFERAGRLQSLRLGTKGTAHQQRSGGARSAGGDLQASRAAGCDAAGSWHTVVECAPSVGLDAAGGVADEAECEAVSMC